MDRRGQRRIKRRIPCEISFGGTSFRGIVLDISAGGMFIQTSAALQGQEEIEVVFPATEEQPRIVVRARVARKKQVPARLVTVTRPGLGVQILEAPPNYERMLDGKDYLTEFRVQIRQVGAPRSRILRVEADDEEEAAAAALSQAGSGWEVLQVEPD
jgi:Tfp pilus assembly protein PilZ